MLRTIEQNISDYRNKCVLVLGLANAGVNAARYYYKLGALVTVKACCQFEANMQAQELLADGMRELLGRHPVALLEAHLA